ncbi:hypothetical protein [Lysinibacillus sp.]|uniref:hypothetical protein n=1 Tax=Lysinibacillus sp. TaxID=1869345 RepID=UPI00289E6DFA|nr:hypothetical protein [Lysinibacillus sp.]
MPMDFGQTGINCRGTLISENYSLGDLVNAYNQICANATQNEMDGAVLGTQIANLEFANDMAIDAGDRYAFLALSGQLKELLALVGEANEV